MSGWIKPVLAGALMGLIAWQGTLMATPFVLMNAAMKKIGPARTNSFHFAELATAERQPIVRPSPDLLYSSCVFDVSDGPVLVRGEPIPGHYWSVSVFDGRTDVAAVRSDRDTGGKASMLVLMQEGETRPVPAGYEVVRLRYQRGIVLQRILMTDSAEKPMLDALRRKSSCGVAG